MKSIIKQYRIILPSLIVGLLFGWLLIGSGESGDQHAVDEGHEHTEEDGTTWTCSMHPQIRQEKPGLCPICAMDLIPAENESADQSGADPNEVSMTESAIALAQIQTSLVSAESVIHEVNLNGKVEADERQVAEATARFGGRIEELFVSFTGQTVQKGDPLATIYSPELVSAQKELIVAAKNKENQPAIYQASREKLALWELSDQQIDQIEKSGQPRNFFEILSPITGTVTMRKVSKGDYVSMGDPLFSLVDLSSVWVVLDAYEVDLPWIQARDPVHFWLTNQPAERRQAQVEFIDPVMDPQKRTARIRFSVSNMSNKLKPGMFVSATIKGSLVSESQHLSIPRSAVLWTGKRSLVYVRVPDRETPAFLMREVNLGPLSGDTYIVENGLVEGDEVVTNGVFKVDASAQLRGLSSMMNPDGGPVSGSHNHGATHKTDHDATELALEQPDESASSEIQTFDVDPLFQLSLNELYQAYLPMKDALVETHARKTRRAAKKLQPVLEAIDMNLLEGDAHMAWMDQFKQMKSAIDQIVDSKDVEMQRKAFSKFMDGFYVAVKSFGLKDQTLFYQYCPMAFNDAGGYWISDEERIMNPYFGDVMLHCGEVKEVIEN